MENDVDFKFDAESYGRGMKEIREAHRYCSGHDFNQCPMWLQYVKTIDKLIDTIVMMAIG